MPPTHNDRTYRLPKAVVEPADERQRPASSPDNMDAWWDTAFKAWQEEDPPAKTESRTPPTNA